tara:strand:- start:287 stop:730 length:444 start_codon:yes stop_codon:yes gene_type:complete
VVTVNLEVNVTAVKGALDKIKRKVPSASAKGIAVASTFIQNAIKDRTRQGKSVNGGGFKRYSKSYAKVRAKRGASLTPNLFFSGQMLGNMSFKKLSSTKGQVFFPNRTQNIKAFFNDQSRPFFSVNRQEEDKAVDIFRKTFERELRI